MDNMFWLVLVYILLSVVILVIAVWIFRAIVRKLAAAWSYSGTLFGDDTKTRLIGLGVSALFFPRVFGAIANFLVEFLYQFFVEAPRLLSQPEDMLRYCGDWQGCFPQAATHFVQTWTSAISESLLWLSPNRFPYAQLILLLATWAIVTLVFDIPNEPGKPGGKRILGSNRGFGLNDPARQDFVFFATLAFAAYLSIVAIITIPSLQETPSVSEEVKVERLAQQLNDMYVQWKDRVPVEIPPTDVFVELDAYLTTNPQGTQPVRNDLLRYQQTLNDMATRYKSLVTSATTQLESAKSQALLEYETTSSNRKGTRETTEHFSSLVTWYRRYINIQDIQITACRSQITDIEGNMQTWSDRTLSQLELNQSPDDLFNVTSDQIFFTQGQCVSSFVEERIPGRPELGSNLGAFSRVASWLLQTESLELAQIVGMLGFGLLGSAVSSLVRKRETSESKRNRNQPIVGDLGVFIIRGATAAVVVFLAVKGGLAIFTSGSGEPSSYVLLLTCFIAAVFSEDVWTRAGNYFKDRLNKDEDDDGDKDKKDQGAEDTPPGDKPSQGTPEIL